MRQISRAASGCNGSKLRRTRSAEGNGGKAQIDLDVLLVLRARKGEHGDAPAVCERLPCQMNAPLRRSRRCAAALEIPSRLLEPAAHEKSAVVGIRGGRNERGEQVEFRLFLRRSRQRQERKAKEKDRQDRCSKTLQRTVHLLHADSSHHEQRRFLRRILGQKKRKINRSRIKNDFHQFSSPCKIEPQGRDFASATGQNTTIALPLMRS